MWLKLRKILEYFIFFNIIFALYYVYYNNIPIWQFLQGKSFIDIINKESVGVIIEKNGNALRKEKQNYLFEAIYENNKVYLNDTILTKQNSDVKIKFMNGEIISVKSNSMIKISFESDDNFLKIFKKKPSLMVYQGNVEQSSNKFKLVYEKPIAVKKNIKKNIVKKDELPFELLKEKPNNYSEIVNQIPSFDFKKDREIASIETPPVIPVLKTPVINEIKTYYTINGSKKYNNYIEKNNPIFQDNMFFDIHWTEIENVSYYHLIVFDKKNLKTIINKKINKNEIKGTLINSDNLIYQIKAFNKEQQLIGESKKRDIVFEYYPPRINFPKDNHIFAKDKNGVVMPIIVSWEKTNYTTNYIISVTKLGLFSNNTKEYTIKENFINLNLEDGEYKCKIRSMNDFFMSEWTPEIIFKVDSTNVHSR